jgi:hypothetical protein
MPSLLRCAFLLAALAPLGACNFWVIPVPIPLGRTTLEPVPVDERPDDGRGPGPKPMEQQRH